MFSALKKSCRTMYKSMDRATAYTRNIDDIMYWYKSGWLDDEQREKLEKHNDFLRRFCIVH